MELIQIILYLLDAQAKFCARPFTHFVANPGKCHPCRAEDAEGRGGESCTEGECGRGLCGKDRAAGSTARGTWSPHPCPHSQGHAQCVPAQVGFRMTDGIEGHLLHRGLRTCPAGKATHLDSHEWFTSQADLRLSSCQGPLRYRGEQDQVDLTLLPKPLGWLRRGQN